MSKKEDFPRYISKGEADHGTKDAAPTYGELADAYAALSDENKYLKDRVARLQRLYQKALAFVSEVQL